MSKNGEKIFVKTREKYLNLDKTEYNITYLLLKGRREVIGGSIVY